MESKAVNPGKAIQRYFFYLLSVCIYAILFCISVDALDRNRTITQFHHTSWTAKDGAPSQISALAQTTDGYLWIGSARGLFRFDGIEFETYVPPADTKLPGHNIYALMATPDGGLWISFRPSGLGFLKDGQLKVFASPEELPESQVYCFARDPDGRVWAGTQTGIALYDGARWQDVGSEWNSAKQRIWSLIVDRQGTLWVGTEKTIVFLPRGSKSFQQTGIRTTNGVPQIAQDRDGRLWMTEWSQPARAISIAGRTASANNPEIHIAAEKLLFDRDGSLWTVVYSDGIRRVRFPERLENRKIMAADPELESFTAADGLSDNTTDNLLEDREGNIWFSSTKGLDRFRHSHLVPVKLPPTYRGLTLLAGSGADIWAASASENPVLRISGERIDEQSAPIKASSVYRDAKGVVWWGGQGGIWRQTNDRFDFFRQPESSQSEWFWEIFPATDRNGLWARLGDVDLVHFRNGLWSNPDKPDGLPKLLPSASYKDPLGKIWLGYKDGSVSLMNGGVIESFSSDGLDIGRIKVIRGRGSIVWFGGELGLAIFAGGRFKTVASAAAAPFGSISGIVETSDGGLWLNEINGIIHISAEETARLRDNPDHRVNYRLYDFLDGMPGGPQMNFTVSTAIEAANGRLWFATDNGLAWIDPSDISENTVAPPVVIRSLGTDQSSFTPSPSLSLPEGTTDLRIDYTALSFSIPEKVFFKYKLVGVDSDWRDAGTRRQAFYNNLGPGHYRFRVTACNNDGFWNETGATLDFTIKPMFYQTLWFRALIILLVMLLIASLIGLIYRRRLARATELLNIGFEERLAERTRIAHELHDTLLQGFFGAAMRLQGVSNLLPANTEKAKENLDDVLDQLDIVLEEGRRAIWDIHSLSIGENDLEQAFTLAGEDLNKTHPTNFSITIEGKSRPLHPLVRDQIYRIGREALINAFRHSRAAKIELEIEYAPKYLRIVICDNGDGIRPDYLSSGREGHLGLSGMREYAEKIGAELKIWSRAESGTEVELIVPQQSAFEKKSSDGLLKLISNLIQRKAEGNARHKNREK